MRRRRALPHGCLPSCTQHLVDKDADQTTFASNRIVQEGAFLLGFVAGGPAEMATRGRRQCMFATDVSGHASRASLSFFAQVASHTKRSEVDAAASATAKPPQSCTQHLVDKDADQPTTSNCGIRSDQDQQDHQEAIRQGSDVSARELAKPFTTAPHLFSMALSSDHQPVPALAPSQTF